MNATALQTKVVTALGPEKGALFVELVNDMKPMVTAIQSKPATTRNYYGSFLALVKDRVSALALICAGANAQGVADAAMINGVKL